MAVDEASSTGISASSVGVSERIVAARLGVSVDTVRRDRRDGRLGGIVKLGEGRRGVVRYDLCDVEKVIIAEKKKRVEHAAVLQVVPPSPSPRRCSLRPEARAPRSRSSIAQRSRTPLSSRSLSARHSGGRRGKR